MATALVLVLLNGGQAVDGWWVAPILLLVLCGYYAYCWLRSGQTLGMKTWRLCLVDETGQNVALSACLIRMLVAPLSLGLAGLGYLWFYISARKQTWHDLASKTYVVVLPKEDPASAA